MVDARGIGLGVDENVRVFNEICPNVREPIELTPAVGEVVQKYCNIVIRIFVGVTACPRTEQHHAFDAVAVQLTERATEALRFRIVDNRAHGVLVGSRP
jgi:hypothetical protein